MASVFNWMIINYDWHKGEIFNVGLSDTNINKQQLAEKIQKHIPDTSVTYSDYYEDPDKRDYIVSNEKNRKNGLETRVFFRRWYTRIDKGLSNNCTS